VSEASAELLFLFGAVRSSRPDLLLMLAVLLLVTSMISASWSAEIDELNSNPVSDIKLFD